jgi:hypothetical protein
MRKILFTLIVAIVFPNFLIAQEEAEKTAQDTIVYITKSGKKYHSANCSYLKGNGIPKKLSEVRNSHSPCSRCNPTVTTLGNQVSSSHNETNMTTKKSTNEQTKTGKTIYTGPRGGKYHYSKSGKKVYEKKRK